MMQNLIYELDQGRFTSNMWLSKDMTLRNTKGGWHLDLEWTNYTDSTKTLSGGIGEFTVAGIADAQSRSLANSDKIYVTGISDTGSVVAGEYTIDNIDEINKTVTLTSSITGGTGNATEVNVGQRVIVGPGFELWATDCRFEDMPSGPSSASLVRNTYAEYLSGDWVQESYLLIANKVRNFNGGWSGSGGTVGFHSDVIQYISAVTNAMVDGIDATADTDTQLVFFENSTATIGGNGRHDRWAIINSVFDSEDNASPPSSPLTQICRTCYGPVLRNTTWLGQKVLFRQATGEDFIPIGGAIQNNIFHENSGQVLEDQVAGDIDNNHYIAGTATSWDENATSGGTVAAVILDRANNNYRAVDGSAVDARGGNFYEGDLLGLATTDGAIGAAATGLPATIQLTINPTTTPSIVASGGTLNWGTVANGAVATRSIEIENTGDATLKLDLNTATITSTDVVNYFAKGSGSWNDDEDVAPDGTMQLAVTFNAAGATLSPGTYTAVLSIPSNDADSPFVLNLSATIAAVGGPSTKGNSGINTGIKIGV